MTVDDQLRIIKNWGYTIEMSDSRDGSVSIDFHRRPGGTPTALSYSSIEEGVDSTYERINWIMWQSVKHWVNRGDISGSPM